MSEAPRIPRGALLGAAALVACTIVFAGTARWTGIGATHVPVSEAVEILDLRFADRHDGAVEVHRADDNRVIDVLAPGHDGFVRVVMRTLARERRLNNQGRETPFRLIRWADGRLSIDDPTTGRRVELGSFGAVNRASFARLMNAGSVAQ